jgi:iron complex outermembrane receptor protein
MVLYVPLFPGGQINGRHNSNLSPGKPAAPKENIMKMKPADRWTSTMTAAQRRNFPSRWSWILTALVAAGATAAAEEKDLMKLDLETLMQMDVVNVTAQWRTENLQKVPISINAFTAKEIEERRIQDMGDLGVAIPGFSVNSLSKSRMNPSLRGGSSSLNSAGAEGAVGLFIDDLYFGSSGDFEFDLFDVERIEILRGPQGTLFGRNTTGGAIVIITQPPGVEPETKLEATLGDYDLLQFSGRVSRPLKEKLYGSLAFSFTDRDGTSVNLATGNDLDSRNKASLRGKLRWMPSEGLEILASLSASRRDESGIARDQIFPDTPVTQSALVASGFVPDRHSRRSQQVFDGRYRLEQVTGGLRIGKKLARGELVSITSARYTDIEDSLQTLAGGTAPTYEFGEPRRISTVSQELRFLSAFPGALNFVSGLYLYHSDEKRTGDSLASWDLGTVTASFQAAAYCPTQEQADTDAFLVTPSCTGSGLITAGNQTVTLDSLYQPHLFSLFEDVATTSYAIFSEARYRLPRNVTLTAGVRWTLDRKSIVGGTDGPPDFFFNPLPGLRVDDRESWDELTYRLVADWQATDDILWYVSTSKGFRSGAYDVGQSDPALSGAPVHPETVFSHEIGFKSRLFEDRVQLNLTAFDVTYRDLQFFVNVSGSASLTTNAGKATVRGIEADFAARLTRNLSFEFEYSHQDGDSTGIPAEAGIAEGVPPQGTIPDTYIAALTYSTRLGNGGMLSLRADYTYKERYGLEFNDVPQFVSRIDGLMNARLAYRFPGEKMELALWGKNLTDEDIIIYGQDLWFLYYDTASFLANPAITETTAQPRYADPRTWGATLKYRF